MHLLITDSGVGGLSVCAYIERFLRTHHIDEPVELTYVNASPENDFGYNAMSSREEKVANFDRFLHIVEQTYEPDMIYIACNTLSVLFSDTGFSQNQSVPVRGIVETGVNRLLYELQQVRGATTIIFGTVTTIAEQTYLKRLQKEGIDGSRIISQACPSLADTISEDREGSLAWNKIIAYVGEAVDNSQEKCDHYLAYLACT
ncbi:aspartate/glutamate racemase family protein, partial [candidate division KSB1 bacterium]|nr:aspartate/glutamate racemase family protein [candidate division KSB1 bacterium]